LEQAAGIFPVFLKEEFPMVRRFVLALAVLVIASGSLMADEIRGTIKKVSPNKNSITLTVNDQDQVIEVSKSTPVYDMVSVTVGRRRRASTQTQLQQIGQGPSALQPGMFVIVTTENRDGVQSATQIQQDQQNFSSGGGRTRRLRR
jgi:hypothetical protein